MIEMCTGHYGSTAWECANDVRRIPGGIKPAWILKEREHAVLLKQGRPPYGCACLTYTHAEVV